MHEIFNKLNIEPLIAMRDYFKNLPSDYGKFNMLNIALDENEDNILPLKVPECGTSMCLLGHLPLLGYPGLEGENWEDYCHRILNIDYSGFDENDVIWDYLFSAYWDNDVRLAITRLDDVINKRPSSIDKKGYIVSIIIEKYNSLFF